jgi:hypothetical protein
MKHITKTIITVLLLACCFNTSAQTEEEMKKWMEYATPSEVHKMLAKMDGEWKEDITLWMDPSAPAQQMQSTCVNKMILGGRYQQSTHTGDFGGMPFEGIGMLAWDNTLKKFVNTWIDNMGTGIMYLEGTWDAATKSINLAGTMTDAMTGKSVKVREVMKVIDDKTMEMTQYTEKDGKEFKNMYIKMTKK